MEIAVLLCTKNGKQFLYDQLISIKKQNIPKIDLYVSDNKSTDGSLELVKKFSKENENINIFFIEGEDLHFANNYIRLAKLIKKSYEFYAFCDQDDVGVENHRERDIRRIKNADSRYPCLHCSRTRLINKDGKILGKSQNFTKLPSFKNALVQSLAGANTMIFNRKAFKLLLKADIKKKVVSHDWLLYIFVTGSGGKVIYDKQPTVLYRQHENNIIGSNMGILNKLKRIAMLLSGYFREYNLSNFYQIENADLLTRGNLTTFESYRMSLKTNFFYRFHHLYKSGVYRQSFAGQLGLILSLFIREK